MSEEVMAMLIVVSFLMFVFTIVRSTQQYKLKRLEQQSGSKSDDSLTTSELQNMIEDAVNRAATPLEDGLDALARRVAAIEGTADRLAIDDESVTREKTVGRPVSQRQR